MERPRTAWCRPGHAVPAPEARWRQQAAPGVPWRASHGVAGTPGPWHRLPGRASADMPEARPACTPGTPVIPVRSALGRPAFQSRQAFESRQAFRVTRRSGARKVPGSGPDSYNEVRGPIAAPRGAAEQAIGPGSVAPESIGTGVPGLGLARRSRDLARIVQEYARRASVYGSRARPASRGEARDRAAAPSSASARQIRGRGGGAHAP